MHAETRFAPTLIILALLSACSRVPSQSPAPAQNIRVAAIPTASSACRTCHPAFYKKWATSHHGQAMQPFTAEFAKAALTPQTQPVKVGGKSYLAVLDAPAAHILERGATGSRKYPFLHVMGGKNVYYFLTPLDRGRLQVLPLAYDIQKRSWYDMAASGVRMHAEGPAGEALPWTDSAFTFNTSCFSCHVSQLKTNYDLASDSYNSTWREPGINCESCHGDGQAHIELYKSNKGEKPADMRILRTTKFTTVQRNEMCAPCHAKMSPVSPGYQVTQRFFDHYDLVTLEDPDFYPDGRDLGENYTYTSWLMSPCVKAGKFDCIHCHTSSGRYRFATENPNGACMPCHQDKTAKLEAHTHHKPGSPGSRCIDCHMPKTRFANMNRSDHSMLPPTPAATLKYKSTNACNLCHKEKDASWADAQVRKWHRSDYQKPILDRAALIDAARQRDWKALPQILAYVRAPGSDHVFVASLIRLLASCPDERKWPVLAAAIKHPSPLVRAAVASALSGRATPESRAALIRATQDDYRLVRIRAAASLGGVPLSTNSVAEQAAARKATEELLDAYRARPDDFANHTNLGSFYMDSGRLDEAIRSFETAIRLRPDSVGSLVNASMAYSRANRASDAERVLRQALQSSPDNAPANFNLGLLLAETGRAKEAEASLQRALVTDPSMHAAAYNLCVLLAQQKRPEAISYCRQAVAVAPDAEKYAFTLAFFLNSSGKPEEALEALQPSLHHPKPAVDTRLLGAELYARAGQRPQAAALYRSVLSEPGLPAGQREFATKQMQGLAAR